jgi:hypothetical protein
MLPIRPLEALQKTNQSKYPRDDHAASASLSTSQREHPRCGFYPVCLRVF